MKTLQLIFSVSAGLFFLSTVLHAQQLLTEASALEIHTPIYQEEKGLSDQYPLYSPGITTRGDLEEFIQTEMQLKNIPGLSASITKEGNVIWRGTFGWADLESLPKQPVVEDTLFMLASVSKTVTATAIMQLWEEGLFDLDDPINLYLPFFSVAHPDFPFMDITFRMLFTHTSGIDDNWDLMPIYQGDSPYPLGTYLREYLTPGGSLYDPDLNFCSWKPGTDYEYSNIGIALVGYLVETISKMEFDEYCQQNIFQPLGMNESSFFLANLDPNHIAMPYSWNGSSYVPYGQYGRSHYPAGQLRTSMPQLTKFLLTFMACMKPQRPPYQVIGSGGPASGLPGDPLTPFSSPGFAPWDGPPNLSGLLEGKTVELMLTPQVPKINSSIGLIWNRASAPGGVSLWGHIGGFYGVRTSMRYGLENEIGLVLLTNGEGDKEGIFWAMYDYALNYSD